MKRNLKEERDFSDRQVGQREEKVGEASPGGEGNRHTSEVKKTMVH